MAEKSGLPEPLMLRQESLLFPLIDALCIGMQASGQYYWFASTRLGCSTCPGCKAYVSGVYTIANGRLHPAVWMSPLLKQVWIPNLSCLVLRRGGALAEGNWVLTGCHFGRVFVSWIAAWT